jgi:hypothetical protein
MGPSLLGMLLSLTACRTPGSSAIAEARADEGLHAADAGTAPHVVLELFTSEGCSSCPPADALLAELAADPRVVALSFHVDYWNELGWPDPFSSSENTARQRAYAASFGTQSVYTPQLVVAGADGFTGSDRSQAEADIAAALSRPTPTTLTLRVHGIEGTTERSVTVDTDPTGAPAAAVVNVALVQRSATSKVRAGENAGRTLTHVDVVRALATSTAAGPSSVRLPVPAGLRPEDAEIVGFVQSSRRGGSGGMPIVAAARAMLPRP